MSSPVKHLWPYIHLGLESLSDSTKEELLRTGVSIKLELVESPKFICGVITGTTRVQISSGCLQMIWACGYLNMMYYDKVFKAGGLTKSVTIDPNNDSELGAAYKLFEWSLNAVFGESGNTEWPADMHQPQADAVKGSVGSVADNMTLEAVGYLLLHEMAHIYLRHGPSEASSWSIEQEKEADSLAVTWFFQDVPDPNNGRRITKGISVATALLMQCAVAMFTKEWGGSSHPARWQRLDQVIRLIETDPKHPVFAFLIQVARMYRTMAHGPSGPAKYADFLDAFDQFIETLSKEHQAQDCAP